MPTLYRPKTVSVRRCQFSDKCRGKLHKFPRKDVLALLQRGIIVDKYFQVCKTCYNEHGISKIEASDEVVLGGDLTRIIEQEILPSFASVGIIPTATAKKRLQPPASNQIKVEREEEDLCRRLQKFHEEEILGAFKKLTNELPQEQKSDENKDLKNLLSVSKAYDVLSNSNTRKKYDKRVLNKAVRRASQQFIKGSFRAMSNEEKARNLGDAAEVDQDVDLKSDDTDEHSTDEEALGEEERMRSIKIKEKLNEKMEFTHLNIKRQKTFKINVWFPETLDFIAYSAGPVDVKLIKIQKIKKVTVGRPPHQVKKKVLGQLTPEWFICVYGVDDEDSLFLIAKDETQRDDWIHMLCWALKEHDNPITPTGVAVPLDLRHEDVLNRRKSTFHRRGQRSSLGKVLPIDVFEKLREGRPFVRVPRHGKPKECNVFLSMSVTGDYTLRWDSSTKRLTECTVNLHDCRLFLGQKTKVFMKHKKKLKQYESTSFSLLNTERSVDLYTTSEETYTMLVSVLKELAKYNPSSVDATL